MESQLYVAGLFLDVHFHEFEGSLERNENRRENEAVGEPGIAIDNSFLFVYYSLSKKYTLRDRFWLLRPSLSATCYYHTLYPRDRLRGCRAAEGTGRGEDSSGSRPVFQTDTELKPEERAR